MLPPADGEALGCAGLGSAIAVCELSEGDWDSEPHAARINAVAKAAAIPRDPDG